ncbi:MAG: DEAD/DEAH box helicase [Candidatus Moraniibacteriota bacterium]
MPEFHFPSPSQLCVHGNPIVGCPLCAEEKKVKAKKNERKVDGMVEKKEKLDYSNSEHLKEIFKNSPIDLMTCGSEEFIGAIFGIDSEFEKRIGSTLLRNFGTKKTDTENMIAILNFAGIMREQKKPECDYANSEHLHEIFKDSPTDLENCHVVEFNKTNFGANGKFEKRSGGTLLKNFGTQRKDTNNMITLLNFAGISREQKKQELIYSKVEHLQEILKDSPIDLSTCGFDEFAGATFGANSRFDGRSGKTLLRYFGTGKNDTKNMIALLNLVGINREQMDYLNSSHIWEVFKDSPIDLSTCSAREFLKATFGVSGKFDAKTGGTLLKNFGTKKQDTENMIALLNVVGIKREQFDYSNPAYFREIFRNAPIDLLTCGFREFMDASFGISNKFDERSGGTLLKNFGTKIPNTENMIALLNFAGIMREQKKPECDYSNSEHLHEIFKDSPIDLSNCDLSEFKKTVFGANSKFDERRGGTFLKYFGTKKQDTENMIALLNFAGIMREQKKPECDYSKFSQLQEIFEKSPIDLRICGLVEFGKTFFGMSSKFEKRRGITFLDNFGSRKNNTENMIDFINYVFPEMNRSNVVADRKEIEAKKSEFAEYVKELSEGKADAKKIEQAMALFGSSRMVDILLHFHPNFKGISVDYVNGELAEYLGDFAMQKRPIDWTAFGECKELLANPDFKSALLELVKEKILADCQKEQKKAQIDDIRQLIKIALDKLGDKVSNLEDDDLWEIVSEAEEYYFTLLDLKKPNCILDNLKHGRTFPDINQLVNIEEIKEKKKLLIADEMGLGKSASVILAKEYLGLKKALIVVPSNVENTWQDYLSDQKGGYFQKGLAPKVLMINSVSDLSRLNEPFDYIVISHEKMKDEYVTLLESCGFDMLIVDEAHKIKNVKGARFGNVEKLAQKIEGEEKYLALLSGTPVPNKVSDVAMILQLLYPERFGGMGMVSEVENGEQEQRRIGTLSQRIIKGDIIDLRNLLIPCMQKKRLAESIAMPEFLAEEKRIEMTNMEKEIYETLLEEDELTAMQKIQVMRQFLLNPETLDITAPEKIEGSKIAALKSELTEALRENNKIVVFVNDYVEDVIRGDKNIISKLDLPKDAVVRTIHGKDVKSQRSNMQDDFNHGAGKMVLFVSGDTADVGVNFSGADKIIHYNEPWTIYDKKQQIGRVYREGLKHDLSAVTMIVSNSIEEGIYNYIRTKEKAIEKLISGIPMTEVEKAMLQKDEKQFDSNLEINAEFAEYYFSSWERLMRMFGYTKEIGEKSFAEFLRQHGENYAECYKELGARSYQANTARVSAAIIERISKEAGKNSAELKILDLASGPELLREHSSGKMQKSIFSLDLNVHHFAQSSSGKAVAGSFANLPFAKESFDYATLNLAIQESSLVIKEDDYERARIFYELSQTLKMGGRAAIIFDYSFDYKNSSGFFENIKKLGFEMVESESGEISSGSNYRAKILMIEKREELETDFDDIMEGIGKENARWFKFSEKRTERVRLKDTRRIIRSFVLNGENYPIELNEMDREILEEEQAIITEADNLRKGRKIEDIPKEEVIDNNFCRYFNGTKYVLFKKLKSDKGAVIIKD